MIWHNSNERQPPSKTQFRVTNTPGGPEYVARYNGQGYPWTIITFTPGSNATDRPKYWCDMAG